MKTIGPPANMPSDDPSIDPAFPHQPTRSTGMKDLIAALILVALPLVSLQGRAQTETPQTPAAAPADAPADAGTLVAQAPADSGAAGGAAAKPEDLGARKNREVPSESEEGFVYYDTELKVLIDNAARQANLKIAFDRSVEGYVATNKADVRWMNITPEQALKALLKNNGLQMIEDPETGVSIIKMRSKEEILIPVVFQVKNTGVTNIAAVVTAALPPGRRVFADPRTGRLVVLASEGELSQITNLLVKLDLPSKQILIEARFIETLKNPKSVKGVDWTGTLNAQKFSFGNGLTTQGQTTTTTPGEGTTSTLPSGRTVTSSQGTSANSTINSTLSASGADTLLGLTANTARGFNPSTAFLNADGVSAVLSFLNTDSDTESIALPRTVTMEGHRAEFAVVRNIPVFEEQQGQLTGSGAQQPPTVKPNYALAGGQTNTILNEVGTKLLVTPRILGDTNVLLELQPEISVVEAVAERKILGGKQNEAPIFARRTLTTQAVVPSGHTLVLGGLMTDESVKNFTKVPILGDVPLLGLAFRKEAKERTKRNLMIFVTPTIIRDFDFSPSDSGHDYLRQKPSERIKPEPNAWDSGTPYDWKKSGR